MPTAENRGCLALLTGLLSGGADRGRASAVAGPLPYRVRDDFLSPAERSFYGVLRNVVGDRAVICPKVGLAEVLFVTHPERNLAAYNRIDRKHVDFVLCSPDTIRPMVAIELDDTSHQEPRRQERDAFVRQALAAAGLPLVRYPVQRAYEARRIAAAIADYLPRPEAPAVSPRPAISARPERPSASDPPATDMTSEVTVPKMEIAGGASDPPPCPTCGIPMVLRHASRGTHVGQAFWGCRNYPKCRQIRPASET